MYGPLIITQSGKGSNSISINTSSNKATGNYLPYPIQPFIYPVPYPCFYYPNTPNNNNINNNQPKSNITKEEKCFHSEPVNLNTLNIMSKSLCKIIVSYGGEGWTGTGFFMKVEKFTKTFYFLISNHHVITKDMAFDKSDIIISIENGKKYQINLDGRRRALICLSSPIDISAVEILPSDKMFDEILFLSYDINCGKGQYNQYINKNIYILQHPGGQTTHVSSGKILKILNGYELAHSADTNKGSSGSPIILTSNNKVIGVHKSGAYDNNRGTFIGKLLEYVKSKVIEKITIKSDGTKKYNYEESLIK
jgi:hypothetical protein